MCRVGNTELLSLGFEPKGVRKRQGQRCTELQKDRRGDTSRGGTATCFWMEMSIIIVTDPAERRKPPPKCMKKACLRRQPITHRTPAKLRTWKHQITYENRVNYRARHRGWLKVCPQSYKTHQAFPSQQNDSYCLTCVPTRCWRFSKLLEKLNPSDSRLGNTSTVERVIGEAKSKEINESLQSGFWDPSFLPFLGFQNAER